MKDDLISRQTAINANVIRNTESRTAYDRTYANGWNDCNKAWINAIEKLPPAQPKTEERTEKSAQYVPNDDLISRKAAIDAVCAVCGNDCDKSEFVYNAPQDEQVILCPEHYVLCKLPSAQPEQKWIPCSDQSDLPKDKRLWITREISDGFFTLREVSDVIWDMTEWSGSVSGVVAYMPYWEPEPYTERREE